MSQIHFGYVLDGEGTDNERVRVLVAASHAGLVAQAYQIGLRLRMDDYVTDYSALEDYDEENIYEVKHRKCSDSKCIVAGAEYPCVEQFPLDIQVTQDRTDFEAESFSTGTENKCLVCDEIIQYPREAGGEDIFFNKHHMDLNGENFIHKKNCWDIYTSLPSKGRFQ